MGMRKFLSIAVFVFLLFGAMPGPAVCEDDEIPKCSGVNRIEINDPAELKGEPNDLKRVTLEIFRTRDSNDNQIRKIEISMEVHSRYYARPPEVCAFIFTLQLTDTTGKTGIVQDVYATQSFPGNSVFTISDKNSDGSIIQSIEEANKIKLICANVQFVMGTFNTETEVFTKTDETEWSDKMVDFADTTQPPNPIDFRAENEYGCVKLSWKKAQKASGEMAVDHYLVYKNGTLLKKLESSTLNFKDCEVEQGKTYKYSVSAVSPWLVESPKAPLTFTYTPAAKVLPEKNSVEFGFIELDRVKPVKLRLTNYGDIEAQTLLEPSDDWITINPSNIKIEKSKRVEIEIGVDTVKLTPNRNYEGTIKITWGTTDFQIVSVTIQVKPDVTPPDITADLFTEVTNQLQYTVTGTVELGASVWVNNVKAQVDNDKFKAIVNLFPAPSATPIEVKASDKFNNTVKKNVGKIINILNSKVVLTIGSEKMIVNDKEIAIKPAPTIIGGKTLVPLRAVADAFGAAVNWDAPTKTATISLRDKTIQITLDKDIAIINGEAKPIGSKAINIGGKILVPFRFIAEALGAKVDYNAETKTITLSLEIRP